MKTFSRRAFFVRATKRDLFEGAHSPSPSVNIHVLNYLLSKMKVKEITRKNPVTVTPETPFEDALRIGQEDKIGAFPVVDDGKLVGMATKSEIVRFLIHALDLHGEGSRITILGLKMISITD